MCKGKERAVLVNEFPSPTFAVNEQGRVSIFLPAMQHEPDNPVLSRQEPGVLFFQRTPEEGGFLTCLSEQSMEDIRKVDMCLIIEMDMEKIAEMAQSEDPDLESAFYRIYEARVEQASFDI